MAAGRTLRSLVSRRRRADDGEEDDDGPVVVEDSQSEGSILSEPEDDEGDGSSFGNPLDAEAGAANSAPATPVASSTPSKPKKPRKPRKRASKVGHDDLAEAGHGQTNFKAMADTEVMMNNLSLGEQAQNQEAVDFETMESSVATGAPPTDTNGHFLWSAEKQRREHEEYKRKRDADPAFIPNRGNFFMHDTRGQPNGQVPQPRGVWQARNRGRGGAGMGGPFSPANQVASAERAADQPWKHDLHDTINEANQIGAQAIRPADSTRDEPSESARLFPKAPAAEQERPRVISFSTTKLVSTVQIRVALAGMKTPVTFPEVSWKQYTRLPDHRPPLRRDKPVRVFLPGHVQRYIFPSPDRSFIFIPRQNRPNQPGYHRNQYQRSIGGYGYSSRRTSMYGGSIYSGSVAPSRRSSMAGISRENAFSPVGSIGMGPSRAGGRLSHGQHFSAVSTPIGPLSGHQTPTGMPQMHSYPPPQQPTHFGTPTTTVHQPRPQKTISVSGIEPPILQGDPQPFRNQLPAHMNEPPPAPYFSPQHMMSPSHPQAGTPLTGIPEQAIHAPSFQPPGYGQPAFYPPYAPPQGYYYPAPAQPGYPQMPMYALPPHHGFMGPPSGPAVSQQHAHPPQQPQPVPNDDLSQRSQSGMVAHESNGMVYYVRASEAQQSEQYQPAESFVPTYAMPGLPPPTPAPENSMGYYYPPMQAGMQDVYYPTQPQQ